MKLYKRTAENGVEHVVQAESDVAAQHMGFVPYEPETKAKTPANKQRKAETKEA
ncbi:hypothetical protein [Corynebacterium macclintockiae]|uniref:hypothetical protein n=1 Tax=Corynebacterium macclintockiae TaxID=2913501 RepID=UPI003EC0274E